MGGSSSKTAEEMAQRDKEMMAVRRARLRMISESAMRQEVSSSFDVPIRRHSINRLMDFDSDVSAVKDLNKPLDNHEPAMRQEVSSSFDVPIRRHSVNRVCLRKLLPSCITSFSVKRKDSQGCTADVKDTHPSPKEKPDFLSSEKKHDVSDDEDLVESPDDQTAMGSTESIDSGVSFKSDQSKAGQIDFKDRVCPRRGDEPGAVV